MGAPPGMLDMSPLLRQPVARRIRYYSDALYAIMLYNSSLSYRASILRAIMREQRMNRMPPYRLVLVCLTSMLASVAFGQPLLDAAQRGDTAGVRAALASGAAVDDRGIDGSTPLLYAAHRADTEMVRALLAAGADANAANRYGVAPLHEAAQNEPTLFSTT